MLYAPLFRLCCSLRQSGRICDVVRCSVTSAGKRLRLSQRFVHVLTSFVGLERSNNPPTLYLYRTNSTFGMMGSCTNQPCCISVSTGWQGRRVSGSNGAKRNYAGQASAQRAQSTTMPHGVGQQSGAHHPPPKHYIFPSRASDVSQAPAARFHQRSHCRAHHKPILC
jgi:hypothetical protein